MASLPPVRTRAEAEADAEFIRGCLLEAGRPDLAERMGVSNHDDNGGGWTPNWPWGLDDTDALLIVKASRLLGYDLACDDCYCAYWDGKHRAVLFDCDHVLASPRGVGSSMPGAQKVSALVPPGCEWTRVEVA